MENALYFPRADEIPRMEEIILEYEQKIPKNRTATQQDGCKLHPYVIKKGVRTAKSDHLTGFTEKVGDFRVRAEGQP